ncbi:MBL fold metallo-hydrolase [Thermonema rossianum]|uniref:MBL fold metallo-hydrolase n=1 Tax=Thermonema rossianum TaxID=55505 RepID=UPI00056FE664|nr:MBL fold metallo-hydrolase [Thermonema rossianum]
MATIKKEGVYFVEQMYTNCLAEAAYYIQSGDEAVVIDPLREPDPYIQMAQKHGAKIKYVFETHFHADFVSGHLDLAKKTGATIVYGPTAQPNFEAYIAKDGEEFKVGKVTIKALHTPGHTMESTTYLLIDDEGKEVAIFTGDTLFIGDVGRPDLAVKTDLTKEDLAGHLYDSLRNKIMPLPDEMIVFPGHGAGSACGKHLAKETYDTLGNQKQTNYALQPMSKEEFIKVVTEGLLPPPQYFPKNAVLNKMGYESYDAVVEKAFTPMTVEDVEKAIAQGAVVLDVRTPDEFRKGHIPSALNIGLDGGMFAVWVGTIVEDLNTPIVLITPENRERETITRLARVGYDHVLGFLNDGMQEWAQAGKEIATVESVSAEEFARLYEEGKTAVLDVRRPGEYAAGHVKGALNYPVDYLQQHLAELDKSKKYYIHCAGGYRSMIACSILKRHGFEQVVDVMGGYNAIKQTNIPKEEAVATV